MAQKTALIEAIKHEIELQKNYLQQEEIQTIYFGGGTPSLLSSPELSDILNQITRFHKINSLAEITLEANPEDLNTPYLQDLQSLGINRLSIGIQSFQEKNLPYLNRNHSSDQSLQAIKNAQNAGFENISLDLIYGLPGNSMDELMDDLTIATRSEVNHISAYSLIVEPKTVFDQQKRKGIFHEISEIKMSEQFIAVRNFLIEAGFEDYETSNFAKNGSYSQHNTSYWNQENYLGIGPSAHSFNQDSRQWNIAKNGAYIKAIMNQHIPAEVEILSPQNKLNEYLMTKLRTQWGVDIPTLKKLYANLNAVFPEKVLHVWLKNDWAKIENEQLVLIGSGKLMADKLSSDLFVI